MESKKFNKIPKHLFIKYLIKMNNEISAAVEKIAQLHGALSDETKSALVEKMKIITFRKDHTLYNYYVLIPKTYRHPQAVCAL